MKLYNRRLKRSVERQIHFGVGKSVETACGLTLYSRHVIVQLGSEFDGAVITDNMSRVTCKRCLKTSTVKLRKLIAIEATCPGVFDRPSLCGEDWLLKHALVVSSTSINSQQLTIAAGERRVTLSNSMPIKDRKYILAGLKSR